MLTSPLVAKLHFLVGGEFGAWLAQQSPPTEVVELVALLTMVRARAQAEPAVPPTVIVPLLQALLGHRWLHGRWMSLAAHKELEQASEYLLTLASTS